MAYEHSLLALESIKKKIRGQERTRLEGINYLNLVIQARVLNQLLESDEHGKAGLRVIENYGPKFPEKLKVKFLEQYELTKKKLKKEFTIELPPPKPPKEKSIKNSFSSTINNPEAKKRRMQKLTIQNLSCFVINPKEKPEKEKSQIRIPEDHLLLYESSSEESDDDDDQMEVIDNQNDHDDNHSYSS